MVECIPPLAGLAVKIQLNNLKRSFLLEASHSGRVHALGKRATCQRVREFESPRFRQKIMFTTYVLQSQITLRYYIGHTSDIAERIERHNSGRSKHTKKERPWVILHQEIFSTKAEAVRREKEIKSYKGGNAFKKLMKL